jgi:two-component system response regulator HydG
MSLAPGQVATGPTVLVVDDNEDVLTAVRLLFERHGAVVRAATSPAALPTLLREEPYDAILLDMNFARDASSGQEGLMWLDRILALDPQAAVVMITAYADVALAVEAMKRGAVDFVAKPWQNEKLLATVNAAARLRQSRAEVEKLRLQRDTLGRAPDGRFPELIGRSAAMRRVLVTIEKVAATDADVLILGENGTGKELVARALHRLSPRGGEVFVSVDVGALPESLFESELFGYARGAFTGAVEDRPGRFEAASGGTLFLDELGNIGPAQQAKLLSALQTRTVTRIGESRPRAVDIRLVSATNQPLRQRVAEGAFRPDLLYRLNTVELHLPPLRERSEDVPVLAEHFLQRYAQKYRRPELHLSPDALAALASYTWPGNVRELQHAVERAVVLAEADALGPADFALVAPNGAPHSAFPAMPSESPGAAPLGAGTLDLEEIERDAIRKALSKHGGNISRAAAELGLTRKSLYRRIEKYGL